jgi:hypothetical protein
LFGVVVVVAVVFLVVVVAVVILAIVVLVVVFAHQAFEVGRSGISFAFNFVGLFGVVVVVVFAIVVRVIIVAGLFGVGHVVGGGFGDLVGVIVIVIGIPKKN